MWIPIVAVVCAGTFAGAALYISVVEHPARVSCGSDVALREFAPSYRRAAVMQASLAVVALAAGLWSSWKMSDGWMATAAVLIGSVVPFTLVVIRPTNARLLDVRLDATSTDARLLLGRWGRLHAVRTILSLGAFALMVLRLTKW